MRSLPGYRGRGSFAAWLHGIAVNLWRDARRRPAVPTVPLDEWAAGGADPADLAQQAAWGTAVQAALGSLDADHRLVVLLHEVAGFRYREIARLLGCPLGTVKSRLHYALAHLRVALEETWRGKTIDELPTR